MLLALDLAAHRVELPGEALIGVSMGEAAELVGLEGSPDGHGVDKTEVTGSDDLGDNGGAPIDTTRA